MKNVAKELKAHLKKELPAYKFSITSEHNSLSVHVMSGPAAIEGNHQINHYYLEKESSDVQYVFGVVEAFLNQTKPVEELTYDSDYGSIPTYYKHYSVGKWDKHYQCSEKKPTAEEMMEDFNYVGSRHHY